MSTKNRIDNVGETFLVSKEIDQGDIDLTSIVESDDEYGERVNRRAPKKSKPKPKKKPKPKWKPAMHLPFMTLELEEFYGEDFPGLRDEARLATTYEVFDWKVKSIERFNLDMVIKTRVTTDTLMWLMYLVETHGNAKLACKFSNGSSRKEFRHMKLAAVHMIKSENGVADCDLQFTR